MVFCQKDAKGIANSENPDQTVPLWVCTVCLDQFIRKLRIITVKWHVRNRPTPNRPDTDGI